MKEQLTGYTLTFHQVAPLPSPASYAYGLYAISN